MTTTSNDLPPYAANRGARHVSPGVTADRLLGLRQVENETSLSRSTIYRLIQRGAFPRPWSIAGRSLWTVTDLNDWFAHERLRQSGKPLTTITV